MSRTYRIAVFPGDGIGPEAAEASVKVLDAVQEASKTRELEEAIASKVKEL